MSDGEYPLKNQRHEKFAQLVLLGETQENAFVKAGYKRDPGHARRLARNGSVRDRITYLKTVAADRAVVTVEHLIADAQRLMTKSELLEQMNAAVGALKELGILTGHRIEKRENTHRTVGELSDGELIELIRSSGAQLPTLADLGPGLAIEHSAIVGDNSSEPACDIPPEKRDLSDAKPLLERGLTDAAVGANVGAGKPGPRELDGNTEACENSSADEPTA